MTWNCLTPTLIKKRERGCYLTLYTFTLDALETGSTNIFWKHSKHYTVLWKYNLTPSPSSCLRPKQQATFFKVSWRFPSDFLAFTCPPASSSPGTSKEKQLDSGGAAPVLCSPPTCTSSLTNHQKESVDFANNTQVVSTQQGGRAILFSWFEGGRK